MNIFVLDLRPDIAAKAHCDKHVVKMIIETAQLLSTAVREVLPKQQELLTGQGLYKSTHKNHPCSIWTRKSAGNFVWLIKLGQALCKEYTYRYGKIHKSESIINTMYKYTEYFPQNFITPFVYCGPEQYASTNPENNIIHVVNSYREYYRQEKRSFAKWTRREQPEWF